VLPRTCLPDIKIGVDCIVTDLPFNGSNSTKKQGAGAKPPVIRNSEWEWDPEAQRMAAVFCCC
jgi:hypothetical protein